MISLLIKNTLVLTMDGKRRIIEDGAIAIDKNRIVETGKTETLGKKYHARKVIDGQGKAALPGLINTHMHIGYVMLKGIASDITERLSWLSAVYPYVILAGPQEVYDGAMLGCLEMIKGGQTYFIENNPFISHPRNTDSIAEATAKSGIRVALARMFSDLNAPDFLLSSTEELNRESRRLFDTWHGKADGRIKVWIYAPGPGIRESPQRMAEIKAILKKNRSRVTSHWAEGGEKYDYLGKYGARKPTYFLKKGGYLGPDTLLVHVVAIDDDEIKLLAESDTKVSHCPTSNLIRAGRPFQVSPVVRMLDAGIAVGLGSDASICNDNSSMFEAMKLAVLGQKMREGRPDAMKALTALEMATINGAKVVGMEKELGSIEKGKLADIILLDLNKPHILPLHNIYENIVYCAHDSDVDTTIINGRVVMAGRKVRTFNEVEVVENAVKTVAALDEKAKKKAKTIARLWSESYKDRYKPASKSRSKR
jgi:5-methylthioadenosine/S-adenosylhomocysteine deaminase